MQKKSKLREKRKKGEGQKDRQKEKREIICGRKSKEIAGLRRRGRPEDFQR